MKNPNRSRLEPVSLNRRQFLRAAGQTATTLAAASAFAPAIVSAESPAKTIGVGCIGIGTRGGDLLKAVVAAPNVKVVAVSDVYGPHRQKGLDWSQNPEAKAYEDYRDLLADPRVDAVVIATPDHWHCQMVLDAVAAGKDIYCEKGFSRTLEEAKRMRDALKKSKVVFQLGHQARQATCALQAKELIASGVLGPVTLVRTGRFKSTPPDRPNWRWYGYYNQWERPDPERVRQSVNWELWLGPAAKIPWNERHFWHWRCYWPYGTGQAGDLLSHELDHVQTVLGWGIPDTCICTGLNTYYHDDREVPDTWAAAYKFEKRNCLLTFEGSMNSKREQPPEYIGREGRLIFNSIGQSANRFWIYPDGPAFPHMQRKPIEPTYVYDLAKAPRWPSHMDDFLQCVRTGGAPKCNIDEAFIEIATVLMSTESYRLKREVRWDPRREEIV